MQTSVVPVALAVAMLSSAWPSASQAAQQTLVRQPDVLTQTDRAKLASESSELATALEPGNGIGMPVLIRQAFPRWTSEAMREKIEGVVELEAVVRDNGTVGDVRIVKSLDARYGLDDQAVKCAKLWLFRPGLDQAGKPVSVRVKLIIPFYI